MPPSHPRPEDLDALVDALSATGEHTAATGELLLDHLVTNAPPKDRELEAEKARERARIRYGRTG